MKIFLCDDAASDRARLKGLIDAYASKHQIDYTLSEFESAEALLEAIASPAAFPTLLFLDIYMNNLTGMDAAKKLYAMGYRGSVIFTTTSREHAVDSYSVDADGYLIKPVASEDFEHAMDRCRAKWEQHLRYLTVISDRLSVNIFLKNIYYIETGNDHCCLIHTTTGIVRTATPMNELEKELQGDKAFVRCYRSYIVNLNMVQTVEDTQLIMKNGDPVMITLRNKTKIHKAIADFLWAQTRE